MCVGVSKAEPQTHATIVATLVLPPLSDSDEHRDSHEGDNAYADVCLQPSHGRRNELDDGVINNCNFVYNIVLHRHSDHKPTTGTIPKLVLSAPPESKAPAAERSPPKPALTLAIPKGQEPRVPVPANARDSVVTEFAEDGEGDMAPGTAIWRPPPTDPQSATTVYFADKTGNWILRNASTRQTEAETLRRPPRPGRTAIQEVPAAPVGVELPSPDHKTRAERAKDAYGGFSPDAVVSPLRLPRKPDNGRLGSPIAFKDQRRELHISSPSLSARLSQTADTIQRQPSQARNQPSDAYPIMMREPRDLTGRKSKRRSSRRASRRVSEGSVTSIESAAEDEDVVADEAQADLSPVVESPHTPISPGKSPVTYPKIHKRADRQQAAAFSKAPEPDLLPSAHKYNPHRIKLFVQDRGYPAIKWAETTVERPEPQPGAQIATRGKPEQARDTTSSQSSLLAKRRGADKAAALSLASSNSGNEMRGTSGGSNARNGRRQQGGSGWKREEDATTAGSPYGPVPITPGWVPELTPTRRGEDLVLNVR
ncbi:hypothetical protein NEMBOFW57_005013 [Staphylotrichum longicolle]|uniref:Uncharacterized protein n=1 Tax=Staphylotrichum longicolle TaxID=669026 RepID=A0AAD4EW50_9PEZI|nr:hypothetical protein NEMBOFW57_005013 [Staphylotrichum longicolle]